jgi:hypothetical protein
LYFKQKKIFFELIDTFNGFSPHFSFCLFNMFVFILFFILISCKLCLK